ncbi:late competence development ComFB family protein [Methylogaea oryzae]|uniref:Uncharacterized protein n=1 Tax=Methylogaea oryzae TaxID=1295382 RepID=A0A8D5AHY3_9GAMM|nr:late competence development ComFB family protein [Methylogaea oryzae]BBL71938.1 hypothetical protein MoryE10_25440 [Methylogaea oryzae]
MHYKNLFGNEELENLSEELVFRELYKIIERDRPDWGNNMDMLLDIAAITLNRVPAKYVTRFVEKHLPREHHQEERLALHAQVMEELPKAIECVVARPRRPEDRD